MNQTTIAEILSKATKAKPKPKLIASTFEARESTIAVCLGITGDAVSGVLLHALLELWLAAKKVKRMWQGELRECLFLSGQQLATLSGLTKKQLVANAVPKLRTTQFVEIRKGRLSPIHTNAYCIHINLPAVWEEVAYILKPNKKVTEKGPDGYTFTKEQVDLTKLPLMFKRLYHAVNTDG